MFCSSVIPTIGRTTLTRAVLSVLDQELTSDDFEVIVVNDSGEPLPEMPWQHSERVRILNTPRRERSVARNTGAAIARGKYLHFLDDDDVFLPGALDAFWNLDRSANAIWLHGRYQTVDNAGNRIAEFDPRLEGNISALLIAGEAVPFQASLLSADYFFAVGGFDPTMTGPEDRDLGRRLALVGNIAGTSSLVSRIRIGQLDSTTDWSTLAERDRWGRERALREPSAYRRLRASANNSYLRGRVSRACFASMVWNMKRKSMFVAASRALAGISFAGQYLFRPGFWSGLTTKIR